MIVHVGILVVKLSSQSLLCNELASVSRLQMQRKILRSVCSCEKREDSQPLEELSNRFE